MTVNTMPHMYKSTQELYGKKYQELLKRFQTTELRRSSKVVHYPRNGNGQVQAKVSANNNVTSGRLLSGTKGSKHKLDSSSRRVQLQSSKTVNTSDDLIEIRSNEQTNAHKKHRDITHKMETGDNKVDQKRHLKLTAGELISNDSKLSGNKEVNDVDLASTKNNSSAKPLKRLLSMTRNKSHFLNKSFVEDGQRSKSEPSFLPPINGLPPLSSAAKHNLRLVQSVSPPVTTKGHLTPIRDISKHAAISRLSSLNELSGSLESLNSREASTGANDRKKIKRKLSRKLLNRKSSSERPGKLHLKSKIVDFQNRPNPSKQTDKYIGLFSITKKPPIDDLSTIGKKIREFKQWHNNNVDSNLAAISRDNRESGTEHFHDITHSKDDNEFANLETTAHAEFDHFENVDGAKSNSRDTIKESIIETEENKDLDQNVEETNCSNETTNNCTCDKIRVDSGKTWKTWRSKNDSFAYSNVYRYMEENQLMPQEKRTWIEQWVSDVDGSFETPVLTMTSMLEENVITETE